MDPDEYDRCDECGRIIRGTEESYSDQGDILCRTCYEKFEVGLLDDDEDD